MASAVVGALRAVLSADTAAFDKAMAGADQHVRKLADSMSKQLAPSQSRVNSLVKGFVGAKEIGLAKAYADAVEQIGGANKLVASDQAKVNRVVQEALAHYKALGVQAPANLQALAVATKGVEAPTKALGMNIDGVIGKARALAGVFGVTLGAAALGSFIKGTFDAADKIVDLSQKMGVSTEAAQRFQYAARQAGAEIEDVTVAIVKMSDKLVEGDKSTVAALTSIGLKFADIRSKKPEEAFRAIADAIGTIPDPMVQAQVALELFGKSGANLLPMIREGALKAADGITVMSDETVKRLESAKQSWENFWNGLTILSGNAIGDIGTMYDALLRKMSTTALMNPKGAIGDAFLLLARISAGDTSAVQELLDWERANKRLENRKDIHLPAKPGKIETDEERKERERKEKEHQRKIKAILDEFTSQGAIERISELSEALAKVPLADITGKMGLNAKQAAKLRKELEELADAGEALGPVLERFRLKTIDFSKPSTFSRRLANDMELLQLIAAGSGLRQIDFNDPFQSMDSRAINFAVRQAFSFADPDSPLRRVDFKPSGMQPDWITSLQNMFNVPKQKGVGDLFRTGFGGAVNMLPETILSALTGGGNLAKSIGSLFGSQIGSSVIGASTAGVFAGGLGKKLQDSFLGPKIGGLIADFIPGLGALLGPALGKLFGAIGGIGKNTTKGSREDFATQMGFGGLGDLYKQLQMLGAEGQKLANIGLNVIGKKDKAANEKWMKDVTAFFDRLERVPGKVAELSQVLGKFGGAVPAQLAPLLDSILANPALSPELRAQLQGMKKPTWQAAQEMADALGIDTAALGAGFNQSRLAERAFSLKRSLDVFGKFAGSDQNKILEGMADEFSALAAEAKRTGAALPRMVQAFIRQVDEMGLLLDENGNRIDSSLLMFADIEDEYLAQAVSLLEQIRDLLTPPSAGDGLKPNPPGFTPRLPGTPPPIPTPPYSPFDPYAPVVDPFTMSMPDVGAFNTQYANAFSVPSGGLVGGDGGTYYISAIDAPSFETFLKQRGGAEAVVRSLPTVVERWGRAQ